MSELLSGPPARGARAAVGRGLSQSGSRAFVPIGEFLNRRRGEAAIAADPARDRRRPLVLVLVFGVFLVLAAITTTAHVVVATTHFATETINATVARDRTLVRIFVDGNLTPSDLSIQGADPARVDQLQRQLAAFVERGEILRLEVRAPDGRVLLSNDEAARGAASPEAIGFDEALAGRIWASMVDGPSSSHTGAAAIGSATVLEEYVPLVSSTGDVRAVFAIWRDAAPILTAIERLRSDSIVVTLGAAGVLAVVLHLVFRAANARLKRQTAELVEATRLDALTGLLNHGALVATLAGVIDSARPAGARVEIALIDIDNFRLLNDSYGHEAGDAILLDMADSLAAAAPSEATLGRYGPDEFLLIAPGDSSDVLSIVELVRAQLAEIDLQIDGSERLPLTISAGICSYPLHAEGVTELLATAAIVLREAKSSGGDRVVVADARSEDSQRAGGFDVLQGLVLAVDAKDRYTKRHSEDVARYALFIADQLGLDAELRRILQVSGLLHDVGKIGIPDEVLRKPGKLTESEMATVQQHVKLGDMIVRDLPDIDMIRAGIRFHHERWDGRGYLDHLAGEEIPLVARILSVADTFSAMTTSRPYRKAFSVEEALRRLGDAAGTQLQEDLVMAFIRGIETAPDPPLPGVAAPALLWKPLNQVV